MAHAVLKDSDGNKKVEWDRQRGQIRENSDSDEVKEARVDYE